MQSQQGGSGETCVLLSSPFSFRVNVNHRKSILFPTQNIFGNKFCLFVGFSVTRSGGRTTSSQSNGEGFPRMTPGTYLRDGVSIEPLFRFKVLSDVGLVCHGFSLPCRNVPIGQNSLTRFMREAPSAVACV